MLARRGFHGTSSAEQCKTHKKMTFISLGLSQNQEHELTRRVCYFNFFVAVVKFHFMQQYLKCVRVCVRKCKTMTSIVLLSDDRKMYLITLHSSPVNGAHIFFLT